MSSQTNAEFYAQWLNDAGLTGQAVEIGVFRGDFSEPFLDAWEGETLHLVDPWHFASRQPGMHGSKQHLEFTRKRLHSHAGRAQYHVMVSVNAAKQFDDNSLDFVYVDGDHKYPRVKADLEAWWPKLKVGALFAGHDFRKTCGVPRAVREFCQQVGHEPRIMPELDCPEPNALWHFTKEKP